MIQSFRNGQWVKFSLDGIIGPETVHKTQDGLGVGIFQKGQATTRFKLSVEADINGQKDIYMTKDTIVPVDLNGSNILKLIDGQVVHLKLDPSSLKDLQPVLSREDIPSKRLENCSPDWHPKA